MTPLGTFPTLEAAKLYSVPAEKTYNSNEMAIILAFNDLYLYFKNHAGGMQSALYDRIKTSSAYDFRNTTEDGVILQGMLNAIIQGELDETHKQNLLNLQVVLVGGSNATRLPYESVTQADYDQARLAQSPSEVEVNYPSQDYILNKYREKISVIVNITEALPFADSITFIASSGNTEVINEVVTTNYALDNRQRAVINVPANFVGALSTEFNYSGLLTKVKAFASSKYTRDFTASITNSVG